MEILPLYIYVIALLEPPGPAFFHRFGCLLLVESNTSSELNF